jgi:hypothetical protein
VIPDTSSIFEKGNFGIVLSFPTHLYLTMMSRPSTSNPLFEEMVQDEMHDYVTKGHLFGIQRALHQESEALGDRIEQLGTDLRQMEARTRDYLDAKLSSQMEEFHELMVNRASSTTSSSRRCHSS